jgi:hypothetical protein
MASAIIDRDPGDEAYLPFNVIEWRFDQLLNAGYDVTDSIILAEAKEVDLHQACELLKRGCPADEALLILL